MIVLVSPATTRKNPKINSDLLVTSDRNNVLSLLFLFLPSCIPILFILLVLHIGFKA